MAVTPNPSKLKMLQSAKTLHDLAQLLDVSPKGLAFTLYKIPDQKKYSTFEIDKKDGSKRTIRAPIKPLKLLQKRLAELIYDCVEEIEKAQPHHRKVSHGFHRSRTIASNASPHTGRRYVLNLDIEDFFGSINFGRVRGVFISNKHFGIDPKVSTIIAQISCHENQLPQGAPSSPIISNLVGQILDSRLTKIAKKYGCYYTRYADDLTFSSRAKIFPKSLAKPILLSSHQWTIGSELRKALKETGFRPNKQKTRMQIVGAQQTVTGLTVNQKVNISQRYYRTVRSMCHSLFATGSYYRSKSISKGSTKETPTKSLAPLQGMLAHMHYIKARRDRSEDDNKAVGHVTPESPKKLYRKFLYYKYFFANNRPTIITEGKTDIIYIKQYLKVMQNQHKMLVDNDNNLLLNFVNPSYINNALLGLGSGFGQIVKFIQTYDKWSQQLNLAPRDHPVIILVDNDSGGEKAMKAAGKICGAEIGISTKKVWFKVAENLYLVKTPPSKLSGGASDIEYFFSKSLKKTLVGGKPFDPSKDNGDSKSYGKHVFAEKVVKNSNNPIDFIGLKEIIVAIEEAANDYYLSKPSTSLPSPA